MILDGGTRGSADLYIAKQSAAGSLLWVRNFNTQGSTDGLDLTLGPMGDIYVADTFRGRVDMDPGPGESEISSSDGSGFLLSLDSEGNFRWVRNFDGQPSSIGYSSGGTVHLAGTFSLTANFDPGRTDTELTARVGFIETFLLRHSSAGTFEGVEALENDASSSNSTIAAGDEVIYLAGATAGGRYLARFSAAGGQQWISYFGGSGLLPIEIAIDRDGNVYMTGSFSGTWDFDPGPGTVIHTSVGVDAFIAKYDSGGGLDWVVPLVSDRTGTERGNEIAVDPGWLRIWSRHIPGRGRFRSGTGRVFPAQRRADRILPAEIRSGRCSDMGPRHQRIGGRRRFAGGR